MVELPEGLIPGGRFADWSPGVPSYVVADVDGTLIARGTTATPVVAEAVRDAHAAGLRVGFATGRLPVGLQELHGQLEPEGPHIVHNGAQVREQGRPLRTWPLERDPARRLAEFCLAQGLYAELYVGEGAYSTDRREDVRAAWEALVRPQGLVTELDLAVTEVVKATVLVFVPRDIPAVVTAIRRLGLVAEPSVSAVLPRANFINVTSPEADKGTGLAYAAAHLGIGLDEVVAVGDGPNDLSMLAVAGTAMAMGQAPGPVHEIAHVVVPEVEADGVAHALRAAAAWRR